MCVDVGLASFIPLSGDWLNGDPLTVRRNDLPEIDRARAAELIADVDALLIAHAPPIESYIAKSTPTPRKAPLPRADELRFGNPRALEALRANG